MVHRRFSPNSQVERIDLGGKELLGGNGEKPFDGMVHVELTGLFIEVRGIAPERIEGCQKVYITLVSEFLGGTRIRTTGAHLKVKLLSELVERIDKMGVR